MSGLDVKPDIENEIWFPPGFALRKPVVNRDRRLASALRLWKVNSIGKHTDAPLASQAPDGFVHVRGANENNLHNVEVRIPRDSIVAFTGVSGSGKSSLAFGTIFAEAQRRFLESVAPYARRLIAQGHTPNVEYISGLPPAVALQQRRGTASSRSTVGTLTTLSNSVRMLYSRAGTYPEGAPRLDSDSFSPNTAVGACPD